MIRLFPERGFTTRIGSYFDAMYPIPKRLAGAALLYAGATATLERIHGIESNLIDGWSLIGIWSVFALLLILRVMDEFKDRVVDEELFSERPLPSGRVFESDLSLTLALACVTYLLVNAFAGFAFWTALFALGYAYLMFRFFFIPDRMRRSLPLALVTHNPIVAILIGHLAALFVVQSGDQIAEVKWTAVGLLIAMIWMAGFAWEIARKIRSVEEENEYVTYSQLLGPLGAVMVVAAAQTGTFVIGLFLWLEFELSVLLPVVVGIGLILSLGGQLRFALRPSPSTSRLGPPAESYMMFVLLALIAGALLPSS